jgi:hypothetical protein
MQANNSDSDSYSVHSSACTTHEEVDVVTAVFDITVLRNLISEFVGDDDELSSDGDDSQNFDPEERYHNDLRFFDRHGRFRESDEEYSSGDDNDTTSVHYDPEEYLYQSD